MLGGSESHTITEVDNIVTELIRIIQRSHSSCSETLRFELWSSLLDVLINCQNSIQQKGKI
jgi:hypothetical protein